MWAASGRMPANDSLYTACDVSHWLEEIHQPYGKLGL